MSNTAVVIPCYNGAAFIGDAVASALRQSRPVAEIIVVDDGSTDDSVAVVEAMGATGHPVRSITVERNGGPATARNVGIAAAAAPFVAFLDADDRWDEQHCASLLAALDRHPDASLAFARTRAVDSLGLNLSAGLAPTIAATTWAHLLEPLLFDSPIPQSAVIARRERLLAAGGYTDGLRHSEDYDLWLRMAHSHPFVEVHATTCLRGAHPGQATHQALKMYRGAWEARARYRAYAERNGSSVPADRYEDICARAFDRDLGWAWQSRDRGLVVGVLDLAPLVPGGEDVRRRWAAKLATVWPVWRSAAYVWDTLPSGVRRIIRARPSDA